MTFGKGPLIQQKYKIIQKVDNNYHSDFEKRAGKEKDQICPNNFQGIMHLVRDMKYVLNW